jgi:WD40 repeat protein
MSSGVRSAGFSGDGKRLACGLNDGRVLVLDAETFAVLFMEQVASETIDGLAFAPDGKTIACGRHTLTQAHGQSDMNIRAYRHTSTITFTWHTHAHTHIHTDAHLNMYA